MAEESGELPRPLRTRPALRPELRPVWRGFIALCSDRPPDGRIPFTAIDRYAARYGIDDPDEFERFHTLLVAMDQAFVERRRQQEKAMRGT